VERVHSTTAIAGASLFKKNSAPGKSFIAVKNNVSVVTIEDLSNVIDEHFFQPRI
jgi:hypothetical protein